MKDIFLVNYSVRGIKTLDEKVSLSFYKKIIPKDLDTREYNIKGIYGMNGSGKSGIVTSVDILKNILINASYLNNPIVQEQLDAIINKKLGELFIEADFISNFLDVLMFYRYKLTLSKNEMGKYHISYEKLSSKKATSKTESMETVFEVIHGSMVVSENKKKDRFYNILFNKTLNLLSTTSMSALFYERILDSALSDAECYEDSFVGLMELLLFGKHIHVYMDQSDDHRHYLIGKSFQYTNDFKDIGVNIRSAITHLVGSDGDDMNVLSIFPQTVSKMFYEDYEKTVEKLYEFLCVFKPDLKRIEIDKKENREMYVCSLIMVYDSFKIHAEFESTGVKKLINLFTYLKEMVQGGIVFIDEFDSNLHDVYLCALLEYLMQYGEGQLCFTTHNVGPMDVLKRNKKSIDFLSVDHKIYPWTVSGNYSPSKLYRNGMIEGSPFNVDSIDFIGAFDFEGGD